MEQDRCLQLEIVSTNQGQFTKRFAQRNYRVQQRAYNLFGTIISLSQLNVRPLRSSLFPASHHICYSSVGPTPFPASGIALINLLNESAIWIKTFALMIAFFLSDKNEQFSTAGSEFENATLGRKAISGLYKFKRHVIKQLELQIRNRQLHN